MKVFTVYDSKARTYGKPFFANSAVEALRSWIEICRDPEAPFSKFPDDFSLYEIGEYDQESAQFHQEKPHHLSDVVRKQPTTLPSGVTQIDPSTVMHNGALQQ